MIIGLEEIHTSGREAIRSGCIVGRVLCLKRDNTMAIVEGARDESYIVRRFGALSMTNSPHLMLYPGWMARWPLGAGEALNDISNLAHVRGSCRIYL